MKNSFSSYSDSTAGSFEAKPEFQPLKTAPMVTAASAPENLFFHRIPFHDLRSFPLMKAGLTAKLLLKRIGWTVQIRMEIRGKFIFRVEYIKFA
jgi:hypothetical protein